MADVPTQEELMSLSPEYLAEDNSQKLIDASIAFIVLPSVVFALFIVSRIFFAEHNGWDTWTLYPFSYLCSLALSIMCVFYVQSGGAGRHKSYWYINNPTIITTFWKLQTASEFVYMAGITFPKVSMLLLYLRVCIDRRVRIISWVVLALVLGHFVCYGIIVYFAICRPFAFRWDKTIPGGHCGNQEASYKYVSIPNIVTDLAILALPLSTLLRLQMSTVRKVGIVATFLAGSLGIITATIRFVGFYTVDLQSDFTYLSVNTLIYTSLEPSAYFICSCLPGIRPLLRAMCIKSGLGTAISSRYGNGGGSRSKDSYGLHALSNIEDSYVFSVSASKRATRSDDDEIGIIHLHESVHVDSTSTRSSKNSMG